MLYRQRLSSTIFKSLFLKYVFLLCLVAASTQLYFPTRHNVSARMTVSLSQSFCIPIAYPRNSTSWVTIFSWNIHFSLIDFSKKIYDFFHKCPMPQIYGDLFTKSKGRKLRLGEIWLPQQNAMTRVRLLYHIFLPPLLIFFLFHL